MLVSPFFSKGQLRSYFIPSLLFIGLLLLSSCKTIEPIAGTAGPTKITLKVKDAPTLFAKPNYNKPTIKATCKLTDNRTNNGVDVDPYAIESIVNIGKNVNWKVTVEGPSSGDYEAEILMIEEKQGSQKNFFGANILPPNGIGEVNGLANAEAKVGNHYTYSIFFSLKKGDEIHYYSIDPKLKGNN